MLESLAASFVLKSHAATNNEHWRKALLSSLEEQNIFLRIPTEKDCLWRVLVKVNDHSKCLDEIMPNPDITTEGTRRDSCAQGV